MGHKTVSMGSNACSFYTFIRPKFIRTFAESRLWHKLNPEFISSQRHGNLWKSFKNFKISKLLDIMVL